MLSSTGLPLLQKFHFLLMFIISLREIIFISTRVSKEIHIIGIGGLKRRLNRSQTRRSYRGLPADLYTYMYYMENLFLYPQYSTLFFFHESKYCTVAARLQLLALIQPIVKHRCDQLLLSIICGLPLDHRSHCHNLINRVA